MRAEDKKNFLDDLYKVNGRALYILARHTGDMQVEFYSDRGSLYNIAENKVYCNLINDRIRGDNIKAGFKLGMLGFLHETGPYLETLPLHELYDPDVAISMKGDCYDNNFRLL